MKIDVYTADYAMADDRGKLNSIGLGWTTVGTPLPPHTIAVLFRVEWHETNERYKFTLDLLDADGNPVVLPNESGESNSVISISGEFEQGRPPGLVKGTPLNQPFTLQIPGGLPLAGGRRYEYRVSAAGTEGSAAFSVLDNS